MGYKNSPHKIGLFLGARLEGRFSTAGLGGSVQISDRHARADARVSRNRTGAGIVYLPL